MHAFWEQCACSSGIEYRQFFEMVTFMVFLRIFRKANMEAAVLETQRICFLL